MQMLKMILLSTEESKEYGRESFFHLKEYIYNHEQKCKNMNVKDASGEISEGNEEHVLKSGGKAVLSSTTK